MSVFQIQASGFTTLDLNDGVAWFQDYVPTQPGQDENGDFLVESIFKITTSGTATTVKAKIEDFNRYALLARERVKRKAGARVYAHFRPNGYATTYRAEILNAWIEYAEGVTFNNLNRGNVTLTLHIWTREWESTTETEIKLSNGNGTQVTGGLGIINHDDSTTGHDNWVKVLGSDVDEGDLPSPIRLTFLNTYNSSLRYANVFVGHNWRSAGQSAYVLEGENANSVTPVADANSSNGYYVVTPTINTSETNLLTWTLSTAMLNNMANNYFRVFAHIYGGVSTTKYRLKVLSAITVLYAGAWATGTSTYVPIDVIKLSPWVVDGGDYYPLEFGLYAKHATGGFTASVDYLTLIAMDGWRQYTQLGYGIGYGVTLTDDNPTKQIYTSGWTPSGNFTNFVASGPPLTVMPGVDQYYNFSIQGNTSTYNYLTGTVRMYYRPRRSGL